MLIASLFLLAVAADAPAADANAAAAKAPEEKICQRMIDTGSHLPRRMVCMTQKQWNQLSSEAQHEYERTALNRR